MRIGRGSKKKERKNYLHTLHSSVLRSRRGNERWAESVRVRETTRKSKKERKEKKNKQKGIPTFTYSIPQLVATWTRNLPLAHESSHCVHTALVGLAGVCVCHALIHVWRPKREACITQQSAPSKYPGSRTSWDGARQTTRWSDGYGRPLWQLNRLWHLHHYKAYGAASRWNQYT